MLSNLVETLHSSTKLKNKQVTKIRSISVNKNLAKIYILAKKKKNIRKEAGTLRN